MRRRGGLGRRAARETRKRSEERERGLRKKEIMKDLYIFLLNFFSQE